MLSQRGELSTARRSCGWRLACLQAVGDLNEHVLLSKKKFVADISQASCKMIFMLDLSKWIRVPSGCCFGYLKIHLALYIHAV